MSAERLVPYVSRLAAEWLAEDDERRHRRIDGTLVFADISGFTRLTERLAARGKQGAEELSDALNRVFAEVLEAAYAEGGWLVKWGGDAVLMMYDDPDHASLGARAAVGMRAALQRCGSVGTSAGRVRLRMSAAVHSGPVDFVLVGSLHRELLVTGPIASEVARLEALAAAGEIAVSGATAARLPGRCRGVAVPGGVLLRAAPPEPTRVAARRAPVLPELATLLPESLRRHVSDPAAEHETHRQVAVGFGEFRGTDVLAATDPEHLVELLARLTDTAQHAAHAHGVTFLESDFGRDSGKLMFVAGAPQASAHAAEAMLRTMWQVVATDVSPLTLRGGVTAGRVFTALIGPPYRRCYSAKGDVVNLAARLMASAEPGQVRAAADVLPLCRSNVAATRLDPLQVKGKARPVDAVVVTGLAREHSAARDGLPFVGRAGELATLTAALSAARRSRGRALALVGDAGLGKTRLLGELAATAGDCTRIAVSADPYESTTPYSTLQRLLRTAWAPSGEHEGAPADAESLSGWAGRSAPDLLPWLPLLGAAVGITVPETPEVAQLDPRFRAGRVGATVGRALAAMLPGPAVIVVDDAHDLDDASAQVLSQLGADAAERPWLIVVAGRHTAAVRLPDADVLHLGALPPAEVRRLVDDATDAEPWPPHAVAAVVDRVEGNPGFLDELLRMPAASRTSGGLPASIERAVAAQLDALPADERGLLRVAAVLGTRFERSLLAAVVGRPDVDAPLRLLSDAGLLVAEGEDRWRFRNALVRDTAYEALPYRHRAEVHGRAADLLAVAADADGAAVLALHLFHARRPAAALTAAVTAAQLATARYADAEAAELYELAIDCMRKVPAAPAGASDGAPPAWQLEEWLGDARTKLGLLQPAAAAYVRARGRKGGDRITAARLCLKLSFVNERLGRYPTALRWQSRGLGELTDVPAPRRGSSSARRDVRSLQAELWMRRAFVCFEQGNHARAGDICRRVIRLAEESGRRDVLGRAYQVLDGIDVATGTSSGQPWAAQALDIFRELDDPVWQGKVLNQLGLRAHLAGCWDEARDWYQQAHDALIRAGDVGGAAVASANLAELLCDQGHVDEAADRLTASLRVWRASHAASHLAFGMAQLGRVRGRMGDHGEALRLLDAASDELAREGLTDLALDALAWRAEVLLGAGDARDALALAREALRRLNGSPSPPVQAPLLHRLVGGALARLGDVAGARTAYAESATAARGRQAWHEVAFTLDADIALDRDAGVASAHDIVGERDAIATRLGLVDLPSQRHPAKVR